MRGGNSRCRAERREVSESGQVDWADEGSAAKASGFVGCSAYMPYGVKNVLPRDEEHRCGSQSHSTACPQDATKARLATTERNRRVPASARRGRRRKVHLRALGGESTRKPTGKRRCCGGERRSSAARARNSTRQIVKWYSRHMAIRRKGRTTSACDCDCYCRCLESFP